MAVLPEYFEVAHSDRTNAAGGTTDPWPLAVGLLKLPWIAPWHRDCPSCLHLSRKCFRKNKRRAADEKYHQNTGLVQVKFGFTTN